MENTKLGLPVGLLIALAFLLCLFGGYLPALLLVGYVFLREESETLKKGVLKAFALMIAFDLLLFAVNLIPSVVTLPKGLLSGFGLGFLFNVVDGFFDFIVSVVSLAERVIFVVYALLSWKKGAAPKLPLIDKLIDKALGQN